MSGWLALSDRDQPVQSALPDRVDAGTLVIELSWPLPMGVMLDWRDATGRALSIFHHVDSGIGLMWRDGSQMRRYLLPGRLRSDARLTRLLFHWECATNAWSMRLDDCDDATIGSTYGLNPPGFPGAVLAQLCQGRGVTRRDSSVLWYGVTEDATLPARTAWIGRATPIPTLDGDVPAGLLQPGRWIVTRDSGPVRLRSIRQMEMPSRGSHAAVVLRAPYFATARDLVVSADQRVVVGGLEAEYLFGEEEVLVAACALIDGRSALSDNRRATTPCVSLDLGGLHLIDVQGCGLMTAHHGPVHTAPLMPLRALHDYEALPLMSLLRRLKPSDAA